MVAPAGAADPGYGTYTDWLGWARLSVGAHAGLASSYDRSGGNYDFSQYEYPVGLCREAVPATVKTITGPGIIYRFWMPHLTADRAFAVRMFFDGEAAPRIDTTSNVVFAQQFSYFSTPFVNTCAGGQVCYEPIPFAESLRIETVNHTLPADDSWSPDRHYYQYTYATLPPGTQLTSYTGVLTPQQEMERSAAAALFTNLGQHPAGDDPGAVVVSTPSVSIPSGGTCTLLETTGPGVVRRLNLAMTSASDADLDGLHIVAYYDTETTPAIDVPVAQFFGAGHLRASYRSLPLGTDSPDGYYSYWPMPFRQSISVALHNTSTDTISIGSARVEYLPGPLGNDMCYLRVHACTDTWPSGQGYHPILSATGRGHYVGSFLFLHSAAYSFRMLEGDEVVSVDGSVVEAGTGTEDAHNGGYYYNWVAVQSDEPEGVRPQTATRPLSGILHVHSLLDPLDTRVDQYRWYVADRVPFESSIDVKIEKSYSVATAEWTSVAFWYQQPLLKGDLDNDGDVDGDDLILFVEVLLDPPAHPAELAASDMTGDGAADGNDVPGFVDAFLNE